MKFDITDIKKESGAVMEIRYQGPLVQDDLYDMISVKDDVLIEGTLTNQGEEVFLSGVLKLTYTGQCARCLKPVTRTMTLQLNERFSSRDTDDDDVYPYEGNFVDLTKTVNDNIIVALPVRLLCSEQCKGLCPVCGKNLNQGSCQCRPEQEDKKQEKTENPFGILKDYFSH